MANIIFSSLSGSYDSQCCFYLVENMCPCIKKNSPKNLLFIFNDKKVMPEKDAKKVRSATLFCDTFKNGTFSKQLLKNNMHTALLKAI